MLNTNILYLIFYLIFSLFPQLTAVDDVLPQYLLIFIIQPITFVLIKQLHGLCSELAVVYVCIFPCLLSVFSLLFSHFYIFVIAYSPL